MNMIRADLAHTKTLGNAKVKVGVMDTGVDSSHPDIKPNFDQAASRNFVQDIPTDDLGQTVDGPCEFRGCVDPVGWDDNGHGTHVAGTIAAAANGFGVSGVAPKASIVKVRAGQDSGYFFTLPTLDALTYSGDAGLDVVNMSFYVDPWLYNCAGGAPEDSPEEAADQDTIRQSVTRALNYAHRKGVTLVAADGNEHSNMADPAHGRDQPGLPGRHDAPAHHRQRDLPEPARRRTARPRRDGARTVGQQGRLLELHRGPDLRRGRGLGSRRLVP